MKNMNMKSFSDENGYLYYLNFPIPKNKKPRFVGKNNPYTLENISKWLILNRKSFRLDKENVYVDAKEKLKFICLNCEEIFYMNWGNVSQGQDCSVCSGRQVGKYSNLKYLNPGLSEEWSSLNSSSPEFFTISSNKIVFWCCKSCGHTWKTSIFK